MAQLKHPSPEPVAAAPPEFPCLIRRGAIEASTVRLVARSVPASFHALLGVAQLKHRQFSHHSLRQPGFHALLGVAQLKQFRRYLYALANVSFHALLGVAQLKHSPPPMPYSVGMRFPCLIRRGAIEARRPLPPRPPTPPSFHALLGVAQLKPGFVRSAGGLERSFHALLGVAQLKPPLPGACGRFRHVFPCLIRRGAIEASEITASSNISQSCFHALLGVAQLKLTICSCSGLVSGGFPCLIRRGAIEAMLARWQNLLS